MGFTYKGTHTLELGIVSKIKSRQILPLSKESAQNLIAIDGDYDFSTVNEDGRMRYENRIIEIECKFKNSSMIQIQKQASKIARWLTGGYGDLIFDDMPSIVWDAKVSNQLSLSYLIGRIGIFSIMFKCKPFSHLIYGTTGPSMDSSIKLDSDVLLDESANYMNHVMESSDTIIIDNKGTWYVKPVVEITGHFSYLSIICNDKTLIYDSYLPNGEKLIFDCERNQVTTGTGINATEYVSGDFLELSPGENIIRFFSTSMNFDVFFGFVPNFIFGEEE